MPEVAITGGDQWKLVALKEKKKKNTGKNSKEHFINSKNSGNEKKVKENYHFADENWEKSILHGNFLAEGKKSE